MTRQNFSQHEARLPISAMPKTTHGEAQDEEAVLLRILSDARVARSQREGGMITLLPGTLFKIDQQKRKGDRSANSRGKVIDSMFNKKAK